MIKEIFGDLEENGWALGMVAVCFCFALVFFLIGQCSQHKEDTINAWPAVNGTMYTCKAIIREDDEGREPEYDLRFQYGYQVNGTQYENTDLYPFQYHAYSKSQAEELSQKYAEGTIVTVHYNPENPEEAYMYYAEARYSGHMKMGALYWIAIGIIFFIALVCYRHIQKAIAKRAIRRPKT